MYKFISPFHTSIYIVHLYTSFKSQKSSRHLMIKYQHSCFLVTKEIPYLGLGRSTTRCLWMVLELYWTMPIIMKYIYISDSLWLVWGCITFWLEVTPTPKHIPPLALLKPPMKITMFSCDFMWKLIRRIYRRILANILSSCHISVIAYMVNHRYTPVPG